MPLQTTLRDVSSQTFQVVCVLSGRLGNVLADKQIFPPKTPSLPLFITDKIDIISQYWLGHLKGLRKRLLK